MRPDIGGAGPEMTIETPWPDRSSAPLRETHLDLLLTEELETNFPFARWLAEQAFANGIPSGMVQRSSVVANRWDGTVSAGPGENDLDVEIHWSGAESRRLLIENKVRAPFQKNQAERYAVRVQAVANARGILVAPASYLAAHPTEAETFRAVGDAVSLEQIAAELESQATNMRGALQRRLEWRADVLRGLCEPRQTTPDHPPTVAFTQWCTKWLQDHGDVISILPAYTRTSNQSWIFFEAPEALSYKCSNGRVDVTLKNVIDDPGLDAVATIVASSLPPGFAVTTDTRGNTVIRYEDEPVSPQEGLTEAGDPHQREVLERCLSACVGIARWLEAVGSGLFAEHHNAQ